MPTLTTSRCPIQADDSFGERGKRQRNARTVLCASRIRYLNSNPAMLGCWWGAGLLEAPVRGNVGNRAEGIGAVSASELPPSQTFESRFL